MNFEQSPELADLFSSKNPARILALLEAETGSSIIHGKTLVFLDEIQAVPQVIETFRYFFEKQPEIHLVAAGSLLEFALERPAFPVPVGRVEFMHIGPMDFDELIGGMPAAVSAYARSSDFKKVEGVKQSILQSFTQDFGKYAGRSDPNRLRKVFDRIPLRVGGRLKYAQIDRQDSARNLSHALHLLNQALVTASVYHTSANGVPLRAEIKESIFKPLFLDVGLMSSACGLNLTDFFEGKDVLQVNQGAISEQFVGQHLLYRSPYFIKPEIFFWSREHKNANAEVDYVLSEGSNIVPIEVKSGKSGTLKSLQVFLAEKKRRLGVRINAAMPEFHDASFALPGRTHETYRLLSLPLYMITQMRRLIADCLPSNTTAS